MKRFILVACSILCCAGWSVAQSHDEYPKNEFFAGYSYHSADINTLTIDPARTGQNGVNIAYTRNLNQNIGITGDISAHFKRDSQQTSSGGVFERQRDQYYFLGGVKFKPSTENRAKPFVHALLGASLFRGFTSDRGTSGNVFTFDDATSFALALGGGLDVKVNDRVSIRVIQADYTPTFFGSGRQDNIRLSFGVVFK